MVTIEDTADGPRAVVGDRLVEHAAACLADALRALTPAERRQMAEFYAAKASDPSMRHLGPYWAAVARLVAEVEAEEVRRLNAALLDA